MVTAPTALAAYRAAISPTLATAAVSLHRRSHVQGRTHHVCHKLDQKWMRRRRVRHYHPGADRPPAALMPCGVQRWHPGLQPIATASPTVTTATCPPPTAAAATAAAAFLVL